MHILVTGGSGVLGRALRPLAAAARHDLATPTHVTLDLFDPDAVTAALLEVDAVMHLATRIRRLDLVNQPEGQLS